MNLIAFFLVFASAFLLGVFTLLGYMVWRMMGNDGWDDSNITNALRLLSHVVLHPNDFRKMYYLSGTQIFQLKQLEVHGDEPLKSPFWYITEDEFEGVVKTRPPAE